MGRIKLKNTIVRGFRVDEDAYNALHKKHGRKINLLVRDVVWSLYKEMPENEEL